MADKILVVDDDLDTLRLVGLMLERQGYSIVAASNGQQALNLAKTEKPSLILLDLMMPDIDGVEVARRLRADPETRNIFIIMFTAKVQMEDRLDGFEAGADAYLTKPIQPRELIANVKAVLQRVGSSITASAAPVREFKDRGETIAVISAKGGVGVSTTAVNLGLMLQTLSKKPVIVADFCPGAGTLALELGITNAVGFSHLLELSPAAITPEAVERELSEHSSTVRFLFSSSRPTDTMYLSAVDTFDAVANGLSYLARFIILDLGAGFTPINAKVLERCQQVVVVTEPVSQTLFQTKALVDHLSSIGIGDSRLTLALVNRVRAGIQLSLGQVQDELGYPVAAVFTAAPDLAYQSQLSKLPMVMRQAEGVTIQQFNGLAQKVLQRAKV